MTVNKPKARVYWSRAKNPELRLWRQHVKVVQDWFGAEFFNMAAVSGDDFVYSKTSMGRIVSRIVKGRIEHRLGDDDGPLVRGLPKGAS